MVKTALIFGVSGQDGALLARLLVRRGYVVHGTSRDASQVRLANLVSVGVHNAVTLHSAVATDSPRVLQLLSEIAPDEIYFLSGQSSVGLSFEQPVETLESIAVSALNVLEALRILGSPARMYNAGSSECFGDIGIPADEASAFRPRSPYAVAKSSAHWAVANYREAYGLFACTGVLFNHESPLRPERFVTRKVIASACRIKAGSDERLRLGNLDIERDWGWAPEYVEAMWRMLQQPHAEDFVIATGATRKLQIFVATAFAALDLDWHDHVDHDASLCRPSEILQSRGRATKAERELGWKARMDFDELVVTLVRAEQGGPWPMDAASPLECAADCIGTRPPPVVCPLP